MKRKRLERVAERKRRAAATLSGSGAVRTSAAR